MLYLLMHGCFAFLDSFYLLYLLTLLPLHTIGNKGGSSPIRCGRGGCWDFVLITNDTDPWVWDGKGNRGSAQVVTESRSTNHRIRHWPSAVGGQAEPVAKTSKQLEAIVHTVRRLTICWGAALNGTEGDRPLNRPPSPPSPPNPSPPRSMWVALSRLGSCRLT